MIQPASKEKYIIPRISFNLIKQHDCVMCVFVYFMVKLPFLDCFTKEYMCKACQPVIARLLHDFPAFYQLNCISSTAQHS